MGRLRGMWRAGTWPVPLAAAVLLLTAGPARAAMAYTGEATAGETAATAYGYVTPQGEKTYWTFLYGTTSKYGSYSQVESAGAGDSALQVIGRLASLRAGTTYHYRLFALPYDAKGNPDWVHASVGRDSTFTTTRGSLDLLSSRLSARHGTVSVPVRCTSTLACSGRLTITAQSTRCASTRLKLEAGARSTLTPRLSASCARLLQAAGGHRLSATASGRLSTGQSAPSQTVILTG